MAETNKKKILRLAIEGAEAASDLKVKLSFLQLAIILQGTKLKKDAIEVLNPEMASLLGIKK